MIDPIFIVGGALGGLGLGWAMLYQEHWALSNGHIYISSCYRLRWLAAYLAPAFMALGILEVLLMAVGGFEPVYLAFIPLTVVSGLWLCWFYRYCLGTFRLTGADRDAVIESVAIALRVYGQAPAFAKQGLVLSDGTHIDVVEKEGRIDVSTRPVWRSNILGEITPDIRAAFASTAPEVPAGFYRARALRLLLASPIPLFPLVAWIAMVVLA